MMAPKISNRHRSTSSVTTQAQRRPPEAVACVVALGMHRVNANLCVAMPLKLKCFSLLQLQLHLQLCLVLFFRLGATVSPA